MSAVSLFRIALKFSQISWIIGHSRNNFNENFDRRCVPTWTVFKSDVCVLRLARWFCLWTSTVRMDSRRSVSFRVHMESSPKRYHHVYLLMLKLPARPSEGQGSAQVSENERWECRSGEESHRIQHTDKVVVVFFKCSTAHPLCGCGILTVN